MKTIFSAVLGFSVLVDLALAAWAGVSWGPAERGIPSFLKFWLPSLLGLPGPAAAEVRLLGLVLALCLLGFAALQGMALRWVLAENEAGHRVAIVFGVWLVVSSIAIFLAFQRWEFLLVDGLRGAALAILGVVALRAPAIVRELRLPDRPRERRRGLGSRRERDLRERRRTGSRDRNDRRPESDRGDRSRDRGPERDRASGRRRDRSLERRGEPARAAREPGPEESDRSLKVVIHGAPERVRPASALAEDRSPDAAADREGGRRAAEGRGRRRRRRRRATGDAARATSLEADRGPAAEIEPEDAAAGEDLFAERRESGAEERAGGDAAVRSRRRRRRRPPAEGGRAEAPDAAGSSLGEGSPRHGPSPVEALDMLSLLEPVRGRRSDGEPFGRNRRLGPPRPARPSPIATSRSDPGSGRGETPDRMPPPSVRPDYGREEGSDSEREPD